MPFLDKSRGNTAIASQGFELFDIEVNVETSL